MEKFDSTEAVKVILRSLSRNEISEDSAVDAIIKLTQ